MNKALLLGAVLLLIVGGYFLFSQNVAQTPDESVDNTDTEVAYDTFTDTERGVRFTYKTSPDGYVLDDLTALIAEQPEDIEILKIYRLMNAREKAELEASKEGREGPPTISLIIFDNPNNQSASMWVDAFPLFSNINFVIGAVDRDAVVGGANAVRYRIDGLYQSENVIIAQGGYIYHFAGAFLEEDSDIYRDFEALIDSVTFVPSGHSEAKIDVRVACESALAYMLFETGDAADAFVEACVNGEHPEVIERYISDMGLDGAAI